MNGDDEESAMSGDDEVDINGWASTGMSPAVKKFTL